MIMMIYNACSLEELLITKSIGKVSKHHHVYSWLFYNNDTAINVYYNNQTIPDGFIDKSSKNVINRQHQNKDMSIVHCMISIALIAMGPSWTIY